MPGSRPGGPVQCWPPRPAARGPRPAAFRPPPAARRPRFPNTHSMSTKLSWHPIRRLATALPRGSRPTAGRSVPIAAESGRPGGSAATRAPVCSGAACASDTTLTPCVLGRTRARRRQPFGPLPVRQLPCYHSVALSGHSVGAWRSLAARIVRDDEVGGSNPLAPTITSSSARNASARPLRTAAVVGSTCIVSSPRTSTDSNKDCAPPMGSAQRTSLRRRHS